MTCSDSLLAEIYSHPSIFSGALFGCLSHLHEAGPAYNWQFFLGHSQPPQTNTSLFCTLCPHSCAPRKYFLVGHPSLNFSTPSTLNFRVLWRWASKKEVATCWYESSINLIKPWAGCYILSPLRDRRPRRSTQARNVPSWPRPCIQCQRMCHAV